MYETRETMYTDQTGKFPHTSSRRNRYQMILHYIDSNTIWVETLKDKTSGEKIIGRQKDLHRMKICSIVPKRQILDNGISQTLKDEIIESVMTYQLVLPNDHFRNIA